MVTAIPSPSIDDSGHPESQHSPMVTTPSHNGSMPACYGASHLKADTFEQNFLVLQNNIYLIFFLLKALLLMNRTKPPEHFCSYIVIIKAKLFERPEIGHRGGITKYGRVHLSC